MSLEPNRSVRREDKERLLNQRGLVIWLYGLSGAGKSTLAAALERQLHADGFKTVTLDGDQVRQGLCRDLGFSMADRTENVRRVAEMARIMADAGLIVIASFITPARAMRQLARQIIGAEDFMEVYLRCPVAECQRRDVKGLYAQAQGGEIRQFTGLDSVFEEPDPDGGDCVVIDTETPAPADSLARLYRAVSARLADTKA